MRHHSRISANGFSLVELMVVLGIVAILAAIAIPAYDRYVTRAKVTEGLTLAGSVSPAIIDSYQAVGTIPSSWDTSGLRGSYVSTVNYYPAYTYNSVVYSAMIIATFGPGSGKLSGGSITLVGGPTGTVTDNGDGTFTYAGNPALLKTDAAWHWYCHGDGTIVTSGLVPASCQ